MDDQSHQNNSTHKEMVHIELIIGRILQIGVIVAAVVMLFGLILLLAHGGNGGYPVGHQPTTIGAIIAGTVALKPYAVMMVGMFCLIMTPVLRVVVSIYAFYKEHDTLYVWITSIVLVILCVSFVIGHTV